MASSPLVRRAALTAIAGTLLASGCRRAPDPADPAMLSQWMQTHFAIGRFERLAPPVMSRISAYASVALYEGIAAGSPSLRSLAGQLNGLDSLPRPEARRAYDWPLVAVHAQVTVLRRLIPDAAPATRNAITSLEQAQVAERRTHGVDDELRTRSLSYGERLGNAIADWATRDRWSDTRTLAFAAPAGDSYWIPTGTADQYVAQSLSGATDMVAVADPTATLDAGTATERSLVLTHPKRKGAPSIAGANPTRALEPFWGTLRPFAMDSGGSCAPPPPVPYSTDTASAYYKDAWAVYNGGKPWSDEEREIGLFWADNPGQTGSAPAHWTSIMGQLVAARRLDPERTVEMYALTSMAQADAFIAAWNTKFRWNTVRPVTYIDRVIDPKWRALIVTPPFPEYPSAHSVQSGAAAAVLASMFGDRTSFIDSTQVTLGRKPRRYASFSAAADEVSRSRLYAGVHYPTSNARGLDEGRCVAAAMLRRVHTRKGA